MAKKLYVGGLAYSVTDAALEALFAQHGAVKSDGLFPSGAEAYRRIYQRVYETAGATGDR